MMDEQSGIQHPPIPPENPAWENLNESFRNSPQFYGEFSWDGVAMRVLGHMAHAYRDLAQWRAHQGDLAGAAELYTQMSDKLARIRLQEGGESDQIRDLYVKAGIRDAALLKKDPTLVPSGPVSTLRRRLFFAETEEEFTQIVSDCHSLLENPPWADVDIASFENFESRHVLRVTLTELALDEVDPFSTGGGWGYWTPSQSNSAVMGILAAAESQSHTVSLVPLEENQAFSIDDLGWLPTGDSYIDTAGEPGPMAIGTLQRLGLDDPQHRARLEAWASELNNSLVNGNHAALPGQISSIVDELNQYTHGSRFYNVKQAINSGVRQAAMAGSFSVALEIMRQHRPLHSQDWACPNRLGIQLGIEGRLQLLSGDPEGASTLRSAIDEGERWLELIGETSN